MVKTLTFIKSPFRTRHGLSCFSSEWNKTGPRHLTGGEAMVKTVTSAVWSHPSSVCHHLSGGLFGGGGGGGEGIKQLHYLHADYTHRHRPIHTHTQFINFATGMHILYHMWHTYNTLEKKKSLLYNFALICPGWLGVKKAILYKHKEKLTNNIKLKTETERTDSDTDIPITEPADSWLDTELLRSSSWTISVTTSDSLSLATCLMAHRSQLTRDKKNWMLRKFTCSKIYTSSSWDGQWDWGIWQHSP